MRKFALTLAAFVAFVGFAIAANVTFIKWDNDKNELTVKEGDKEATYKVTDKTKVKRGDMDVDIEKAKKSWVKNGEQMSGKTKMEITVKDGEVLEIKTQAKKNKDK